jgi:predicted RNase H-like nuclease
MEQLGKKISKQTWYILPKVREVDALLRQHRSVMLRESHPEVVFKALNKQSLSHSKKTIEGREERLAILNHYCPEWISVLTDAIEQTKRSMAQPDDLIDAFALMLIASKWPQLSTLPEMKAPLDNEIVYWQAN